MTDGDQEWLPMPSGISITTHDSFTTDLLRQFDKKSAELLYSGILFSLDQLRENGEQEDDLLEILDKEKGCTEIVKDEHDSNSVIDTVGTSSVSICMNNPSVQGPENGTSATTNNNDVSTGTKTPPADSSTSIASPTLTLNKRRSAGNLLRKSSMFLKDKLHTGHHHTVSNDIAQQPLFFHSLSLKRKKRKDVPPVPQSEQQKATHSLHNPSTEEFNLLYHSPSSQHYKKVIQTSTAHNTNHHDHAFDTLFLNTIKPPIITHYPPKPLKYSPVEPLPEPDGTEEVCHTSVKQRNMNKKKLQRLSLPLLKLSASTQKAFNTQEFTSTPDQRHQQEVISSSLLQKQKSHSDILNPQQQQQQQHRTPNSITSSSVFHTLSRQWNKLIVYTTSCKKK